MYRFIYLISCFSLQPSLCLLLLEFSLYVCIYSYILQAVFEKRLRETAMAMPLMCCGADLLGAPSRKQVVIVGDKASEEFDKMLAAAHSSYNPNKTVK